MVMELPVEVVEAGEQVDWDSLEVVEVLLVSQKVVEE